MANSWYTLARQDMASKLIDLINDDLRILLATAAYTPSLTADHFVSDIPSGAIIQRSGTLSGRSFSGRYLMASNVTMSLVPISAACPYVVLYQKGASDAASRLLVLDDTGNNLPVKPDGGDLVFQFSTLGVCEI